MLSMAHKRNEMYYDGDGIACTTASTRSLMFSSFLLHSQPALVNFSSSHLKQNIFIRRWRAKSGRASCTLCNTHSVVVIPENECRWLRRVVHDAGKIYSRTALDVQIRCSNYFRWRFCTNRDTEQPDWNQLEAVVNYCQKACFYTHKQLSPFFLLLLRDAETREWKLYFISFSNAIWIYESINWGLMQNQ